MRLLDAQTFEVKDRDQIFENHEYATVSHRCTNSDAETTRYTLEALLADPDNADQNRARLKDPKNANFSAVELGLAKVAWGCYIARRQNIDYIWIDTICIDKSTKGSIAVLNQDMNSMFRYYKEARVCFAFLLDTSVRPSEYEEPPRNAESESNEDYEARIGSFEDSVWFERGWTLQELLASNEIRFYDYRWRFIGTKQTLCTNISEAANIDIRYLDGRADFRQACVAERMSWMSKRRTKLKEDMAYCMFGVLGVGMDTRYGEHEQAFQRLEERIVDKLHDESIFVWSLPSDARHWGLLAPWPSCFRDSRNLTVTSKYYKERVPYKSAKQGVEFNAPSKLPNHVNREDWNNLRAAQRTSYELGLNCWSGSPTSDNHITLHLEKVNQQWRRVASASQSGAFQKLRWAGGTLRSSHDIAGWKTRPIYVPHVVGRDEEWGRKLAAQTNDEIVQARRNKKRGFEGNPPALPPRPNPSVASSDVDSLKDIDDRDIGSGPTPSDRRSKRLSIPSLPRLKRGSLQFRSPIVWNKSENG